jgi:large subunit ribosomal protein L3
MTEVLIPVHGNVTSSNRQHRLRRAPAGAETAQHTSGPTRLLDEADRTVDGEDSRPLRDKDTAVMANKALVGEKVGMTQIWDDSNRVVPVTVVKIDPLRVVQVKTSERDGYSALQVTYGRKQAKKLTKPEAGHFAKHEIEPGQRLLELRLDDIADFAIGQELTAGTFAAGDVIDVTAVSKGKGFAGVMKRHNFSGQKASHGAHRIHRAPGSIGACATPARVFKGTRMAGRLGGERVTTLNLLVVEANDEQGVLLVRGAVPGPKGGVVVIRNAVKRPASAAAGK